MKFFSQHVIKVTVRLTLATCRLQSVIKLLLLRSPCVILIALFSKLPRKPNCNLIIFLFIESKEGESNWLTYVKLRKFKSVSADNLNYW